MVHSDGVKSVHETLLSGLLSGLANAVCVKRISGGQGKGKEEVGAGQTLSRVTFLAKKL